MSEATGGCLCGKVRYTAPKDPVFQAVCHCTDCQRQTGTSFSVVVAYPAQAVTYTGEMKVLHCTGESGGAVIRRFCPECGSPIVSEPATSAGMAFLKAGTLDDTSNLNPTVHIYTESKQPWVIIPEGAMTFPRGAS